MTPRVAIVVFPGTWSDRDFLDVAPVVGWEARQRVARGA